MSDNATVAVAIFAIASIEGQWCGTVTAPLHELPIIAARYHLVDRAAQVYPHTSWTAGSRLREWDLTDLSDEWERLVSAYGEVQTGDGETVVNLVLQTYGSRAELARAMRTMYSAYVEAVKCGKRIDDGALLQIARLCYPEEEELREIDAITAEDLALVREEAGRDRVPADDDGGPHPHDPDDGPNAPPDHPLTTFIDEAWKGKLGDDAMAGALQLFQRYGAEVTPEQVMAKGIEGVGQSPPRAKALVNILRDYALDGK